MSYILDALRKADAQRERDPSRGIHAQPAAPADALHAQRVPAWGWGGAALAGAALVAWFAWPAAEAPVAVTSIPSPVAMPEPAPSPAPAVVNVATSVQPPAPPPLPMPVVARAAAPALDAAKPKEEKAAPAPAVPAAAPASDRVLAVAELPPDVQRELPKLAISGGVYSENAAQRMLIVGGQVVNEGAELAAGVVLEQIRARNAVLRYRGFRYSVPF